MENIHPCVRVMPPARNGAKEDIGFHQIPESFTRHKEWSNSNSWEQVAQPGQGNAKGPWLRESFALARCERISTSSILLRSVIKLFKLGRNCVEPFSKCVSEMSLHNYHGIFKNPQSLLCTQRVKILSSWGSKDLFSYKWTVHIYFERLQLGVTFKTGNSTVEFFKEALRKKDLDFSCEKSKASAS